MSVVWLAGLALAAAAGVGPDPCPPAALAVPDGASVEIVEEHWPDGGLRLRKQVLRLPDGTRVDHGRFRRWHENGQPEYDACFVHGQKEGTTFRYHDNGRIAAEKRYHDGRRDGRSTFWDAKGEKVKEESWADGQPDGVWTIWEDGKLQWRHAFHHGVPDP